MIDYTLDKERSILYVRPVSSLEKNDFSRMANDVDPFISDSGDLSGLIIDAPKFPGWDSFGALVAHMRFVRDHHKHIKKVCIVTDSSLGNVAEHLGSHFVAAEIRHFPGGKTSEATQWVMETEN